MRKIFAIMLIILPSISLADTVSCKGIYIEKVVVEGDRDDNMAFANHFILSFKDSSGASYHCADAQYTHLPLNHTATKMLLSTALSAQAMGREVDILVNTNDKITTLSNQLSAIVVN